MSNLQAALLQDERARAAIVPLFNLSPNHPDWLHWQRYYLNHPEAYPASGDCPLSYLPIAPTPPSRFSGIFHRGAEQDYTLTLTEPDSLLTHWKLVTLLPEVDKLLQMCLDQQLLTVWGRLNQAGNWLLVEQIEVGI